MRQPGGVPRSGYPPGGVPRSGYPPGGVPRSGYPPGGWVPRFRYPPPPGGVPRSGYPPPGGGTEVWVTPPPPGGVPRSGYPPWGGTEVRVPPGGGGGGGGYRGPGYPPGGVPRSGYPPGGVPRSGYPPGGGTRVGQQKEYSLHGGRYASCVHAGGLSCLNLNFTWSFAWTLALKPWPRYCEDVCVCKSVLLTQEVQKLQPELRDTNEW